MNLFYEGASGQVPDLTVIIPTRNRLAMLKEALTSALSQNYDGTVEMIVVDDASDDQTAVFVAHDYPHIRLISLPQRSGNYKARNEGIQNSRGRYVAFLDDDDLWETDYLKIQIAALEGREKAFSVSGFVKVDMKAFSREAYSQKPDLKKYSSLLHHILVSNFITTLSSVVFPRKLFNEAGLFDSRYRLGGDAELYTRALMAGYEPVFTEAPLAVRRIHTAGQMTDAKNLRARKRNRFERVKRLYPIIANRYKIPPLDQIYGEIHASFAYKYFTHKLYWDWICSSLASARYASLTFAISNMKRHLKSARFRKYQTAAAAK